MVGWSVGWLDSMVEELKIWIIIVLDGWMNVCIGWNGWMAGRLDGGIIVNLMRVLDRMFYGCMAVRPDG